MMIEFWVIVILMFGFVGMTCWNLVLLTRLDQMKKYIKRIKGDIG